MITSPSLPIVSAGASVRTDIIAGVRTGGDPTPSGTTFLGVRLTDPDLNALLFRDVNFDGDETVSVDAFGQGEFTFTPATQGRTSAGRPSWTAPAPAGGATRTLELLSAVGRNVAAMRYTVTPSNPASAVAEYYGLVGQTTFGSFNSAPLTGAAQYQGVAVGTFDGAPVSVTANFGSSTISGSINTTADPSYITFTLPIQNLGFVGPATVRLNNVTYTGRVSGDFYGPNASELGGVYGGAGLNIAGAFTALRQ